jgi:hypothetical protein
MSELDVVKLVRVKVDRMSNLAQLAKVKAELSKYMSIKLDVSNGSRYVSTSAKKL